MSSTFALRQRIARLNRLDARKSSYSTLLSMFHDLARGMAVIVGTTLGQETFFRARCGMDTKPTTVGEVHAPPAELVGGFQRCNPPRRAMFYAASRRSTALLEIGVTVGDKAYLSQWMGNDKLPISRIFDETLEENWQALPDERSQLLHTYLETLFTRRIHETFSDQYKLTAAVTEVLTTGFREEEERCIGADGFIALRYPSVVDIERSYNTVMHPKFALERLDLCHVAELTITDAGEDYVRCEITDNAFEFPEGHITWSGNPLAYPMRRPGGAVPFIMKKGGWRIALNSETEEKYTVDEFIAE